MVPPKRRLAAVALVALLVTSGCSALTGLGPTDPAFGATELGSFQTFDTRCGDARTSNSSTVSRPVAGGRKLSVNTTVPVRSNATDLSADFERIGEHRYVLDVERRGGSGTPDCYLETRYNATVNLTDDVTDRYTLLVTYDGVLVSGHYADSDSSGATRGLAPETRYAPWARNVSDADGGFGGGSGDGAGGGSDASA
ncbi:hypothetical protein N0B31_12980 [Salinirubellus salinus]|uniref:Lipoprotein n=1 Tax=Salinirubellus salinus TaxID=1364945 RepID=A0A9E7R019_9EURY|nr:hypothetical protein [Salinirubellus salinus]UWM53062.1 hypothetical protein N0B31_12980 [Salinirubellus salinus]